jgi:hypothetical protein
LLDAAGLLDRFQPLKEDLMFARNVSIHLKSNSLHEFGHVFESQILPLLRKQKGFRDEITIASSNGLDVTAISLWDTKADADAYNTSTYPEVVKTCSKLTDGSPRVQNCDVVSSTYHKVAAEAPVHA